MTPLETLQESLRRRLREKLGMSVCGTCGHATGSLRQGAKVSGIKLATLHRFLAGKNTDGATLDAIDAYVNHQPTAKGHPMARKDENDPA